MENPISTTVFRFITVRPFKTETRNLRIAQNVQNTQNWRVALPPPPQFVEENSASKTLITAKINDYSLYLGAIDELKTMLYLEAARIVPQVPQVQPLAESAESAESTEGGENANNTTALPQPWTTNLSEKTRVLLEKMRIADGYTPHFILNYLEQKASDLLGSAAVMAQTSERVVAFAGGVFSPAETQNNRNKGQNTGKSGDNDSDNSTTSTPNKLVQPLGIADFRRVEQTLKGYETGEIAHIENVLIGEKKNRTTRHLLRMEESTNTLTESESIKERDTQTTDRFELQKESEKAIQQASALNLGASIAASYGPVKATISADYSNTNAQQQSDREAVRYGKETTARALERLTERVRTERATKRLEEWEDTTLHEISNLDGTKHVTGVYRWLDKVYEARIVNYGKRLMFEFVLPEPAANYLALQAVRSRPSANIEKPKDPWHTDHLGFDT